MVTAKWIGDKLVVEELSKEKEALLPQFVQDTLDIGSCAVLDGLAYAKDEDMQESNSSKF